MKYSVTLISDDNYEKNYQKYETPHSKYELQKIYEFYMIPRFRTILILLFWFSWWNGWKSLFQKKFQNKIVQCPNLSFGFIFIESSLLSKENHTLL